MSPQAIPGHGLTYNHFPFNYAGDAMLIHVVLFVERRNRRSVGCASGPSVLAPLECSTNTK